MKIIYPFVLFIAVSADEHDDIIVKTFHDDCDITGQVNIPNAKAMRSLKCIENNEES